MVDISERNFEETIEAALLAGGPDGKPELTGIVSEPLPGYGAYVPGGYRKRLPTDYDRALCLDPAMVVAFVQATQPARWTQLVDRYGDEARDRLVRRLAAEVEKRGVLDVFRKGIKDSGVQIDLAYFRPASGLNPEVQTLYEANIFTLVRQLRYSDRSQNSIDTVLFLNGLPVFTAELKNPLNGQTVTGAIHQYRTDRDPREPLLSFGRILAHFAVDPELVYVTTRLEGETTRFLPFNRGKYGGAGNPPDAFGFPTRYLWDHVWSRDSVLELVQRFIHLVHEEDDKGRRTGKRDLIFPRYHQLDAVRRLVADAEANGPGRRYLIQHSAGSGKSNTIAWLAHRLSILHGPTDERVFDSIIVVTDRKVLDRQLQRTVRQFEQTLGVVENIDTTSRQLKDALEAGKTIIVTTLQKFPVIVEEIGALPQRRFAVLIDEAHSSQSGRATHSMKRVLAAKSLADAEAEDEDEGPDLEDRVVAAAEARGALPNLSLFAFTATPKRKTLELFGTKDAEGRPGPFSLYSMRQAIEERFIMDVLQNYTTYRTYWNLLKKIEDDPAYDRHKATYLLKLFVDLHDHAIDQKVAIMVEHFHTQVAHRIGGRAKAMIVTRSRLHAVRTMRALQRLLAAKGYPYRTLVAFSGAVTDGGKDYTEANMNGFGERQTATVFKQADVRFLVVAEKFQTGFDEPLLHTMYVDKRLKDLAAVQTLSRLNRVHPDKEETQVLDFANEADDIRAAFEPYYEGTILSEETDPNVLYDVQRRLLDAELFDAGEVQAFAEVYFDPRAHQPQLYAILTPIQERYLDRPGDDRATFKHELGRFTRLYAFLAQIMPFVDADLEKLYFFAYYLNRKLAAPDADLPSEIQQYIDIESFRIQETSSGPIDLARGGGELSPIVGGTDRTATEAELEPLSQIIRDLNDRFGTEFRDEDRVFVEELLDRLQTDAALEAALRGNTLENARLTFDHVVTDRLQDMVETNFEFYKRVTDDDRFSGFFLDRLFELYRDRLAREPAGPAVPAVAAEAAEIIARELRPRKIILFGSTARGDARPGSDVDLLVVMDRVDSRVATMGQVSRLLAHFRVPIDVLVYSEDEVEQWGDVTNHVINEALLDGRVLYDAA